MTLLGKNSPAPATYAPDILFPIPRAAARVELGLQPDALPFSGEDVWHAWELAWLESGGQPRYAVGRFTLASTTANLVESKSLKLYLNSLNQTTFDSREVLRETLQRDLSGVVDGEVAVELLDLDAPELAVTPLPGDCIDDQSPGTIAAEPSSDLLSAEAAPGTRQVLHSHALRSLCPVTAQPDWASIVVSVEGTRLEPGSLLAYLCAFRNHQEFHEQCVERMFCDLNRVCGGALSIQALYTRRGGIDINPWRSSRPGTAPQLRTSRQ